MRIGARHAGIALASLGLLVAASGSALAQTAAPAASQAPGNWPFSGTLKDGSTFTLKQSTVDKLKSLDDPDKTKWQPINYLFSYGSASIPLFSPQYQNGYNKTIPEAQAILPSLSGTAIAPASAIQDPNLQISQFKALVDAGLVDCLSIQSTGDNAFTKIVNDTMAQGIPVFTVGVQSNGNELTNFTQISLKEGAQAANIVLDWMKANNQDIKVFAVSGGDTKQNWAQGRMKGFVDTIKAALPDATFANDETNGLNTTYTPASTYDAYKAFLTGHPDVQFIENVDIGAEHADRAIKDLDLTGKVHTIGWNVSLGQLDAVKEGTQVAALDQKWGEQAGFGALACADFLKNGIIRPNTQELLPVTAANVDQAREEFVKLNGG